MEVQIVCVGNIIKNTEVDILDFWNILKNMEVQILDLSFLKLYIYSCKQIIRGTQIANTEFQANACQCFQTSSHQCSKLG